MYKNSSDLLDIHKAAHFLGVSIKSIRRWAQKGKLKGIKVGIRGDWRFTKRDLLKFVKTPTTLRSENLNNAFRQRMKRKEYGINHHV